MPAAKDRSVKNLLRPFLAFVVTLLSIGGLASAADLLDPHSGGSLTVESDDNPPPPPCVDDSDLP